MRWWSTGWAHFGELQCVRGWVEIATSESILPGLAITFKIALFCTTNRASWFSLDSGRIHFGVIHPDGRMGPIFACHTLSYRKRLHLNLESRVITSHYHYTWYFRKQRSLKHPLTTWHFWTHIRDRCFSVRKIRWIAKAVGIYADILAAPTFTSFARYTYTYTTKSYRYIYHTKHHVHEMRNFVIVRFFTTIEIQACFFWSLPYMPYVMESVINS